MLAAIPQTPLLQASGSADLNRALNRPHSQKRQGVRPSHTAMAHGSFSVEVNPAVANLKPSKTMVLSDLARSLQEKGVDVISLAAGEPDFDTPDVVIEAGIEALRQGITHYTANVGTAALRAAICKKLESENGLHYATNEVLVPAPYWTSYPEMTRLAGATPVVLNCPQSQDFMLTPQQLEAALTHSSRLLILCSPSNPSGMVYPRNILEQLAGIVKQHPRLMVLSDEIYEHILYPPAEHVSIASLPGMWERTLVVNGFSKAFAMTGWRLGYMAGPKPYAAAAATIQSQSTSGASSIAQHAGVAALNMGNGGGPAVEKMVQSFRKRRDLVVRELRQIQGVQLVEPTGAFYALPDMSSFCGPQVTAKDFGPIPDTDTLCRYLLEKANVATVPGDAFGVPDCIRLSYAASLSLLQQACSRMQTALAPERFEGR
ncbi:hypothetical protein WJX84_005564 [Apatococcus fuscideae]|uniref:Aminotransferase class I/classII large domain-containing protein n=1 Tax=Apatococcus fuscideae TaxID=2026836 RepID=A0AAW1T351_9CHLO